ncbi:uncharacterized protein PHALS_09052 [Plasmopara halstedii]|uniref:Uncharacterized protein n=1 Tax=Plasmopara halstedii TaxID=4781 RepID=A0A0N7L4L2_PLAHL|nr:uncharacterized protein PHALS_09052 [Plasmopara halstedii]CEG38987.1 hypothetical protein PHALS_09052 [Plasmopara halstedii]|eukprot:XP_024575356.1 hypothetical protein PHALS_09052 [Plasmopara halstedii]
MPLASPKTLLGLQSGFKSTYQYLVIQTEREKCTYLVYMTIQTVSNCYVSDVETKPEIRSLFLAALDAMHQFDYERSFT